MTQLFHVGQRLIVAGGPHDGAICTIRYIGEVQGSKGKQWLGIEYDDISLGKHNGELEGRRYFHCQSSQGKPATFIRSSRPFHKPVSFLDALRRKYASGVETLSNGSVDGKPRDDPTIVISGKEVEEVGFDRIRQQQSNLHGLARVILDGESIQATEDTSNDSRQALHEAISRTCPNIVELDLSRNLLETWDNVADICCPLKKLSTLRASGNRFRAIEVTKYPGRAPFTNIKELVLDETLLTWPELRQITAANSFSSLTELSFAANELSVIKDPLESSGIVSLNLNDNLFSDLTSLLPLPTLPCLSRLTLQGNRISSTGGANKITFPSITQVDLSRNTIGDWSFVDGLSSIFPKLTSLRISSNPLYEQPVSTILTPPPDPSSTLPPPPAMTVEEAFMLTLSRIKNLQTLNFSTIKSADRQNAELFYLSVIRRELETVPDDPSAEAAILARHPRYAELCEVYGAPTVARKDDPAAAVHPRSLQARLVNFRFYNKADGAEHAVRIPRTVDVYKVKAIVSGLYGLPALGFKLVHETEELDPVHDTGDDWDEDEDGNEMKSSIGPIWVRREVELIDTVRDVGSFLDDDAKDVRIRIEPPSK